MLLLTLERSRDALSAVTDALIHRDAPGQRHHRGMHTVRLHAIPVNHFSPFAAKLRLTHSVGLGPAAWHHPWWP